MRYSWMGLVLLVAFGAGAEEPRECVLDRVVRVEENLAQDVPEVQRLCDTLQMGHEAVDVGGCTLYCERGGEGTPLVLLHGGPGATHHVFHPHFAHAQGFCQVVYYDQRGCGLSDYEPGPRYSIDQAVDDLEALRDSLGLGKWVVLGHSYGGLLAQCYVTKYPESVAGVVLVCASPAMKVSLAPSRQGDYLSSEEARSIRTIRRNDALTLEQLVFNAHLNGDWKRQNFHRPTREDLARMARYEWHHDPKFRGQVGSETGSVDLRGAFTDCPIPTLIIEAKWDLTWNIDKPEKLQGNHPGSKLVILDRSGHSPFADEPDAFFGELRTFMESLPAVSDDDTGRWKKQLGDWRAKRESEPACLIEKADFGRAGNLRLAEAYSSQWLEHPGEDFSFLKLGFALYDAERYEDALDVFRKMAEAERDDPFYLAVALIWQGHMLDLLGRREEAVSLYEQVRDMGVTGKRIRHDQFGLNYEPSPYARRRLIKPFARVENAMP